MITCASILITGLACLSGEEEGFRNNLDLALDYARALECPRWFVLLIKHSLGRVGEGKGGKRTGREWGRERRRVRERREGGGKGEGIISTFIIQTDQSDSRFHISLMKPTGLLVKPTGRLP